MPPGAPSTPARPRSNGTARRTGTDASRWSAFGSRPTPRSPRAQPRSLSDLEQAQARATDDPRGLELGQGRSRTHPARSWTRTREPSMRSRPASRATMDARSRPRRPRPSGRSRCRTTRPTSAGDPRRPCSRPGERPAATELLKAARAVAHTHGFAGLEDAITTLARSHQLRLGPARTTVDGDAPLSVRELEVLRLMADGKSNPDIAEVLFISRRTAAAHVSNILRKIDATSRVEAVSEAHRRGYV